MISMRPSRPLVETRPTGNGRARGLVSSRSSGRRVEARRYAAPEALGDVVSAFWTGSWDLRGQAPHVTELLSDPCVNFVFEEGGVHAGSRLVGVWTRLWRRTLEGKGRVRGVKLRAGAVRAFVDEPAFRFANRIVPLGSVFGAGVRELERAVLGPEDDAEAFAIFEQWLISRRVRSGAEQVALAVTLVDRIASEADITSVDRLAVVAGLGPRALQRLFREHVGASPKWVIRRNRLQEVALRIERGEPSTLAALAAELGYTDQAHLARDFKSVVGKTPSDFAASVR
jgi:AraC-like DNA-binding protein